MDVLPRLLGHVAALEHTVIALVARPGNVEVVDSRVFVVVDPKNKTFYYLNSERSEALNKS